MPGVAPTVLLDDTIIAGAMREALANRGFDPDTFPPGNSSEPCTTAIEAARQVAVAGKVKVVTTAALVDAGIASARTAAPAKPQDFAAIERELRAAVAVLVQPCSSTLKSPLAAAIEVWEPAVVITKAGSRIVRPRGREFPLSLDPRAWSARASDMLGR